MSPQFHRHSCPACGQKTSWIRLNVAAWVWAVWKCKFCDAVLGFDSKGRALYAISSVVYVIFLNIYVMDHVHFGVWVILLVVGLIACLRFDKIILKPEGAKEPGGSVGPSAPKLHGPADRAVSARKLP